MTHRHFSDNSMIDLWLKIELWTLVKRQLLKSGHSNLLLHLFCSIFKTVVFYTLKTIIAGDRCMLKCHNLKSLQCIF